MMTDDEFKSLATRYLDDAIDEDGRRNLSQELLDSRERVRQFNDLRILTGMILEHGRSDQELPHMLEFPGKKTNFLTTRQWLSAAALVAIGLFVGFLVGERWKGPEPSQPDLEQVAVLIDGGFEKGNGNTLDDYPAEAGQWSGNAIEVTEEAAGFQPFEGKSMLCLDLNTAAPERVAKWQIVNLKDGQRAEDPMVAELCVRFNSDTDEQETEVPCRIEVYALQGAPETAQAQLEAGSYLASASTHLRADADPLTWEIARANLVVAPEADFLLLGISGHTDPQPFGGARHFVDGVELRLRDSISP